MSVEEAQKFIRGLANYESMVPVHRAEFDKAMERFTQSLTLDFVIRLDEALYRDNSSAHYDPTAQVAEYVDKLCQDHNLAFVPHEGVQARDLR